MAIRIPLDYGRKHFTIISAYAPNMTNPDGMQDKFYEDLHTAIDSILKTDIVEDRKQTAIVEGRKWSAIVEDRK